MGSPRWSPLTVLVLAAVLLVAAAQAQETTNGQGKILWAMGKWLSGSESAAPLAAMGWTDGSNPCTGWGGITCNSQGYVTSINLAGKGLAGTIPSDPGLWAGMTALTSMDLSNNQITGSVPAAIKSAPLLNNVNLAENKAMCGYLPTGLPATTPGTGIGVECAPTTPPPPPSTAPVVTPPPPAAQPPAVTTTTPATPATTPNTTAANATAPAAAAAKPAAPAQSPPPAAPQAEISSAPICSCALSGFGSQDCIGALAKECRAAEPPAVCASRASVLNDTAAATAMGEYLADVCFKGQDMDTSVCTCVQNLLGNDCAKARVSLCVKGDPLCLPIQNVVGGSSSSSSSSTAGDAAQQVSEALDAQCAVTEPTESGVKATMEFPETSVGQYISKQYTQNVANALSSVTNVPTSSISTLDVRPFTGTARTAAAPPKRLLLQATASNGVQATYFMATEDPSGVSQRLSTAANDGTLSARLAQYGITAQAGGLRVQNYLQPVPPAPAQGGGLSFPLWALAPIIGGGLLLLGLVALGLWCCCGRTKKRGRKAAAYAPTTAAATKKPSPAKKVPSSSRNGDDLAGMRDMPGNGYQTSSKTAGYAAAGGAGAAAVGVAGGGGYKPASASSAYKPAAPPATTFKSPPSPKPYSPAVYDLSSSTGSSKVGGKGAGVAVAAAAAGAGTAVAMKRAGSNRSPSPTRQGVGSTLAMLGTVTDASSASACATPAGSAHLASLQSMKVREYQQQEPITRAGSGGSSTLTPWEAVSRPGSSSLQPKGASSGVTGGSVRSAGVGAGAAAAAAAGLGGGAVALSGARSGSLGTPSVRDSPDAASGSWKSNVRPASGQMANSGGASSNSMMANPAAKSTQQAERAKFWAQFQETWQQVRQTQNVDNEPGSPSSGTNWTDITDARTFRHG